MKPPLAFRWLLVVLCLAACLVPAGARLAVAAEAAAAEPPSSRPSLLVSGERLERLRALAKAQSPQWRRLLNWAAEPSRQAASPQDGPGLALAALALKPSRPQQAAQFGRLAVACAQAGAPTGQVRQVMRHVLGDPKRLGAAERFEEMGLDLLNPNQAQTRTWRIERFTAGGFQVDSSEPALTTAAAAGDLYLVLTSNLLKANRLAGQTALTLDWAWEWFTPEERAATAAWLVAQAGVFARQAAGCFDRPAVALLRLTALAGLASRGLHPGADDLVRRAHQGIYEGQVMPCLRQAGQGGGWFEGSYAGAEAGLDLLEFAAAMQTAAGVDVMASATWFRDRLPYLLMHLQPGFAASPRGGYLRPGPDGDEVLPPQETGDLLRLQMLMLTGLRPRDPAAGWALAVLSDRHLPRVLAEHWLGLEFLWFEPEATVAPLTSAPLSLLAPGTGRAFLRSDWSERATWLAFSCGPHFATAQHLDAGSLVMYRRGLLLGRGGAYDGPLSAHALNYASRTLAHNAVVVHDPKEYAWYDLREGERKRGTYANDGGQRAWTLIDAQGRPGRLAPWTASGWDQGPAPFNHLRDIYDVARVETLEDQPRYAYLRGVATAAYQGGTEKLRRLARHVFHLRPGGPDDAEAAEVVAVVDDLELGQDGLAPRFVLHFPARPQPAAPLTLSGPGRAQGPCDRLKVEMDGARLEVVSLWPRAVQLQLFGGAGEADSWVGDRNYPPRPPAVNPAPWRAEFGPGPTRAGSAPMVHALLPLDAEAKPALVRHLVSPDAAVVGLSVDDPRWPRVLAVRLGKAEAGSAVRYQHDGRASRHLVAGLAPGQGYAVTWREGMVTVAPGQGLTASQAGLLSFRLRAGETEVRP
jgi:hypothetical protein